MNLVVVKLRAFPKELVVATASPDITVVALNEPRDMQRACLRASFPGNASQTLGITADSALHDTCRAHAAQAPVQRILALLPGNPPTPRWASHPCWSVSALPIGKTLLTFPKRCPPLRLPPPPAPPKQTKDPAPARCSRAATSLTASPPQAAPRPAAPSAAAAGQPLAVRSTHNGTRLRCSAP
jgi:hypothetical protein